MALALGLICIASMFDSLTSLHVMDLPYVTDPALTLAILSIGLVVVADASESATKSAELELERARVVLAERENLAAVGQLAAVVAHEVRNPVTIIFSAFATLRRTARDDEEGKLLGILGEEAERPKQLVSRLLDAVRPFELQYSRRPAAELLNGAIAQVTAGAGFPAAQVELVSAPADEVECDDVLLGQAISNLVQNALVADGRTSPVRVQASVDRSTRPAMLRIEVADDGNGVPADVRPRLFTPFFTTRATGTGLALVKRIAGAHGGTVDYEPPPTRGASFVLRVPLQSSAPPSPPWSSSERRTSRSRAASTGVRVGRAMKPATWHSPPNQGARALPATRLTWLRCPRNARSCSSTTSPRSSNRSGVPCAPTATSCSRRRRRPRPSRSSRIVTSTSS